MSNQPPRGDLPAFPLGRSELIAAGFLVIGIVAIVLAVVVTQGGGSDGNGATGATATGTPPPSASGVILQPDNFDSQSIIDLARRSIEVLPQGQWPSLYDDFTAAFQARCTAEQFAQAGIDSSNQLGSDLALLGFKHIQDVVFSGDTATGIIVGELKGKSEYQVESAFAKEGGVWKIAPVKDTAGCSAFSVRS